MEFIRHHRSYGSIKRYAHSLGLVTKTQHNYSDAEIEIIKACSSIQEAADTLGQSYPSVYNISKQLGIIFDHTTALWTSDEIAMLQQCVTLEEACAKINRPVGSIRTHASNLGIVWEKDNQWTADALKQLKECGSLERAKELFKDRSTGSIQAACKRNNIILATYKNPVWSETEIQILKDCHSLKEALIRLPYGRNSILKKMGELQFSFERRSQTHKDRRTVRCVETGETGSAAYFVDAGVLSKSQLYKALKSGKLSGGYHWEYVD